MNILCLQVPLPLVRNNTVQGTKSTIDYTVLLDQARLEDYNHSILIPRGTIIISDARRILPLINADEFNLSFTQERLMKSYKDFKTKQVNKGLIRTHELSDWLLNNTPVHIDKDSIKQSLELIELNKPVKEYEPVVSQDLLDEYSNAKKSLERIRPIDGHNIAIINNGLSFSGPDTTIARDGLRIKHHPTKATYEFGQPFYTLGQLGKLCVALDNLWNR